MSAIWVLLFVWNTLFRVPALGHPRDGFLGAIGHRLTLRMQVEPRVVQVREPLVLSVIIEGVWNPWQMVRPDLRRSDDYSNDFLIEDLTTTASTGNRRVFQYQLRPRHSSIRSLPPLVMRYWDPIGRYFATAVTEEVASIEVVPGPGEVMTRDARPDADFSFDVPSLHEVIWSRYHTARESVGMALALVGPLGVGLLWWLIERNRSRQGQSKDLPVFTLVDVRNQLIAARVAQSSPREQARVIAQALQVMTSEIDAADLQPLIRRASRLRFGPDGTRDDQLLADVLLIVDQRIGSLK